MLMVIVALFFRDLIRWIRTGHFNENQHIQDLENLICHCWIYLNYENNGVREMTKKQKALFEKTIERQ